MQAVLLFAFAATCAAAQDLRPHVVIVVNDSVPESVAIGHYYATARGIDEKHICHIETIGSEEISREAFDKQVFEPIRRWLIDRRWLRIEQVVRGEKTQTRVLSNDAWIIVTCYGVPVKVAGDPNHKPPEGAKLKENNAAVDDELVLLPLGEFEITGALPNPYFRKEVPFDGELARRMILVGRLDGPSPEVVRRMVDDALYAEQRGLNGIAYFDERGIRSGGYKSGDDWILGAHRGAVAAGFETFLDAKPEIIPEDAELPDAAIYFGWYTGEAYGPFIEKGFRFRRGAIAYHLHSGSATTVRTADRVWVGPLLQHGAAVTAGNVYEPYLEGTPQVDILLQRMLSGYSFIEASYMAKEILSWMNVFLGDPLYRPFGREEGQLAALTKANDPDVRWALTRKAYRLARSGKPKEGLQQCDRAAASQPYLHLVAARIRRELGEADLAAERYHSFLAASRERVYATQACMELAELRLKQGRPDEAIKAYRQAIERFPAARSSIPVYLALLKLYGERRDDAAAEKLYERMALSLRDDIWGRIAAGELWVRRRTGPAPTAIISAAAIAQAPKIDGEPADDCWKRAARAEGFVDTRTGKPIGYRTTVRVAWDKDKLYVLVECSRRPRDGAAPPAGKIPEELRLSFCPPRDYQTRRVFARDIDGKVTSGSGWEVAQRVSDEGWCLECGIPFKELGAVPRPGDVWGANFERCWSNAQALFGHSSATASWGASQGHSIDPRYWGYLVFGAEGR